MNDSRRTASFDVAMMRRALFHAARGLGRTTPNPMVGAIVVSADGVVRGHGWHARAGEPHAEVHALNDAGETARGGTLYVNLEPCCHVGRTGACTRRIIDAGIARVVVAMQDPDPRVSGRGFAELRAHGIAVDAAVCEAEATRLNAAFVSVTTSGRPLVIVKAATSLDARVAERPGRRTQLTSAAANRKTQLLRAAVDAIAIGSETLLVDDPLLTVRECQRVRPLARVVFDRRLRTPATARVLSTLSEGPVIILTGSKEGPAAPRAATLEAAGAVVLDAATIAQGLHALLAFDVSTLLLEGGPRLQSAFCRARLVDRVHLIIAPRMLGSAGVPWLDAETFSLQSVRRLVAEPRGPDTWIEADVHGHC
jgi:diaminohydroxyphosphoribosylaminopyrimidine deaminase/5-amino-6-(5-phosphoribosylamino)uracil reductase